MRTQLIVMYLLLQSFFSLCIGQTSIRPIPSKIEVQEPEVDLKNILINNRWILREYKTVINEAETNNTLLLLPCEKDNYTHYYDDGTYVIFEADNKCVESPSEKKGSGRWSLEEDSKVIFDEYQGGKEREKKVLELTETKLTLEFESEGTGKNILTFYTPEALKDVSIKEEVNDPTIYRNTLLKIIQVVLKGKNRYNILKVKDFMKGGSNSFMKDGFATSRAIGEPFKRNVALYPLKDLTDSEDAEEHNNQLLTEEQLIEQGKYLGVDYIITGTISKAESFFKRNTYKGKVEFDLDVIDLTLDTTVQHQQIEENYPNGLKEAGKLVLSALGDVLGYNYEDWKELAARIQLEDSTEDLSQIFTKDAGNRLDSLDKINSVLSALQSSSNQIEKFIDHYLPIQIEVDTITSLDKNNFARTIRLHAGTNRNLENKDKLLLYEMEILLINGNPTLIPKHKIGIAVIESVNDPTFSIGRVVEGEEEVTALIRDDKLVYAWTTEKKVILFK